MVDISLLTQLVAVHVVAAGMALGIAGYVLRDYRDKLLGQTFSVMVISFAIWTIGSGIRFFAPDPTAYVVVTVFKYVGVATAPVWFLLFALVYVGRDDLVTRGVVAGLLVIPVLTVLILATNQFHGLFYEAFTYTSLGGSGIIGTERGSWFWVYALFGWGLLAIGSAVVLYGVLQRPAIYRAQSGVIVLAIAIPWSVSLAYIFWGWPHPAIDPTPFGFAFASFLFALGLFTTRLIDLVPVARTRVLDMIEDEVFVLDSEQRVVYANDPARSRFEGASGIGHAAESVLASELLEVEAGGSSVVELGDEQAPARVRTRELSVHGETVTGIVLTDLTNVRNLELVREEKQELKRQHERLSEFATAVFHDLRNPLLAAKGYVELARDAEEPGPHPELQTAESALGRMERMIDGIQRLAKEGKILNVTGDQSLQEIAEVVWESLDTGEATLTIAGPLAPIRADRDALVQVFEHLFSNSIEHGHEDIVVSVGSLDDGFFLEDDGPGIPLADQASVFEAGYALEADRPGLGLKIVKMIVEAHGWAIDLETSEAGGTRIEVTGVTSGPS